jgi:hypothetical protein
MLSLVSLNFFSLGFAISTACFLLTAEPITDILEFLAKQYTTVQGDAVKNFSALKVPGRCRWYSLV